MLKVENVSVMNFDNAIRAMRSPLQSWAKSDSEWVVLNAENGESFESFVIGPNDLDLARRLINGGPEHRKFLRQIFISMDVTAPLYWWKETDQYKVGTVTDSTSTMHKIHAKEFTLSDFSCEFLTRRSLKQLENTINELSYNRNKFNNYVPVKDFYIDDETAQIVDKEVYWYNIIQLLPSSYNQLRTWTMNYEVARSIYFQRKDHKLDEWHTLCAELEKLPYFRELFLEVEMEPF